MLRAHWKPAVAAVAALAAVIALAEGALARHLPLTAEANGLVVRTHGSHTACRYGSYGKAKEGWHRHVGGTAYPCVPEATGSTPSSAPIGRGPGSRTSGPSLGPKTGTTPIFGPPSKPGSSKPSPPVQKTTPGPYHSKRR